MMKKIYIMRGISGAGKSFWICPHFGIPPELGVDYPNDYIRIVRESCEGRILSGSSIIFSADYYHLDANWEYNYKPENADAAHRTCFKSYIEHLRNPENAVVTFVNNTNIGSGDVGPYV